MATIKKYLDYPGLQDYDTRIKGYTASSENNGMMSSTDKDKLDGIAEGAEVNVQADWNESNDSNDAYIKNKPSISATPANGGTALFTNGGAYTELAKKQDIIQISTMPEASATYVGKIVQYTGATQKIVGVTTYIHGHFYECKESNSSYSWQEVDLGGGGASSESIAPIESTTTASQAYAVGDLLFYNDTLYRVTSAISSGGTIIVSGTYANVTETDIDTELKTKANITQINNAKTYKLTLTNVSALPQSWSVWGDYLDLQVEDFELSNYNAQLNDWQCSIAEGEIAGGTSTMFTITGNISGSTDITIYLGKPEALTIFDDNFGENSEIDPNDDPIILEP